MNERKVTINIDSDVETRKGVHADVAMLSTKGGATRIDFLNADITLDDVNVRAALASRVYMNNEDVIALRDMLVSHTADWKVEADGEEA